ncbi:galectin-9 [Misgurnus anguillicaudatus]|uniref:galectin-9 n=1 Tax=Misgurnus anguillicaudatus TaxID=75329 RepID=UPI003CCFA307
MIPVPYRSIINGGLKPGKSFTVRGEVNCNPHRIEFNFRHKYGVAFHFNPCFGENKVVCNTWECGRWGPEECPAEMPFKAGQPFEIYIFCTDHSFNVFVNGVHVHPYRHRFCSLTAIDVFEVLGDLRINYVDAYQQPVEREKVNEKPYLHRTYCTSSKAGEVGETSSIDNRSSVSQPAACGEGESEQETLPALYLLQQPAERETVEEVNEQNLTCTVLTARHPKLESGNLQREGRNIHVSQRNTYETSPQHHVPKRYGAIMTKPVPYRSIINGGLKPGKSFTVRGEVNSNPHRIEFNFRHILGVAFHYNPRFDENKVVCNTWDGKWGPEEYSPEMPFKAGQPFEIYIYCTDHSFNVFVNGVHAHSYRHRFCSLTAIDVFEVAGDLRINYVDA